MRTTPFLSMIAVVTMTVAADTAAQAQQRQDPQQQSMTQGLSDAPFVMVMISHHQLGIDMSRVEQQRGAAVAVRELATKIRQSQEKDLSELKAHAAHHAGATAANDPRAKIMAQQSQTTMKRLESAAESELDSAFLEEMAKHHQSAISMIEGAKLQDPELKKLAQKMLTAQRQELEELKKQMKAPK